MSILEVRAISKTLTTAAGEVAALENFSATFVAKKRTAIVGPSGCGKSTLLYLLGLLDTPTSGEIFLQGKLVSGGTAALTVDELAALRNRHLGFVFQFHFLLPELTVEENILLPALKLGVPMEAAREAAQGILTQMDLRQKATRLAGQLSGGEQQRVAVARSLINHPAVVLADEPTGNLDSANSRRVFELLSAAAVERGAALIVVTHNGEIAGLCDEVIELKDGRRAG